MSTKRELLHSGCGVKLWKLQLIHGGSAVATNYLLETLRTPETENFASLTEANAAYLKELGLSEESELVAKRLGRLR